MSYLTTEGKMLFDNFDFRYEKFTYDYPDRIETDVVFRSIIRSQENIGNYDGLKKAQIEYKNYQYLSKNKKFINWINRWWWSYGYEKEKIIWNSILIFLILSFINCPFLFFLSKNLYSIDNIAEAVSQNQQNKFIKRFILNIPYSLMYNGIIFFGVHFSIKNLCLKSEKIKNQFIHHLLILYFFIIYIGGLICIGYIANVIITI